MKGHKGSGAFFQFVYVLSVIFRHQLAGGRFGSKNYQIELKLHQTKEESELRRSLHFQPPTAHASVAATASARRRREIFLDLFLTTFSKVCQTFRSTNPGRGAAHDISDRTQGSKNCRARFPRRVPSNFCNLPKQF